MLIACFGADHFLQPDTDLEGAVRIDFRHQDRKRMNVIPADRIEFSKLACELAGRRLNLLQAALFPLPVIAFREKQSNHADSHIAAVAARSVHFNFKDSFQFLPVTKSRQIVHAFKTRKALGGNIQPVAHHVHQVMKKSMGNGGIEPLEATSGSSS